LEIVGKVYTLWRNFGNSFQLCQQLSCYPTETKINNKLTYQELGAFIRQERKKKHLTQIDLAKLAEIAIRTMKSMEKGERTHENSIRKVMDILSYDIEVNISVNIKVKSKG